MEQNFNFKTKDLIYLIIYITLFSLCMYLLYFKQQPVFDSNTELNNHMKRLDSLTIKLEKLELNKKQLDTIIYHKEIHNVYEQKVFMDTLIITNDSIDKFISSYIKKRQSELFLLHTN